MPKLKTVKGIKARFKVTGTGKLIGNRAGRRHLLTGRRPKRKRQFRRPLEVSTADAKALRPNLPYA